jgi:hypothetical protein
MLLPHELSPMSVPFARTTSQVIYRGKQAGPGTLINGSASGRARCEAPGLPGILGVKRQNARDRDPSCVRTYPS